MTDWKITILVHNYARGHRLYGEHGISLFLEPPGGEGPILFDTGQTGTVLLHNAEVLGIDLKRTTQIVLSHGHYDHTGGLGAILKLLKGPTPITVHPAAFEDKRNRHGGRIGMSVAAEELEDAGAELRLSKEPTTLLPGLSTTGEVPRRHRYEEEAVEGFQVREGDGSLRRDPIPDDLSLILNLPEHGLFLICGCCHAGLINSIEHAQKITGVDRIAGVLGGLHTIGASRDRLEATFAALERINPEKLYPLHCAGQVESVEMLQRFPDRATLLTVGESITV